METMLLESFYHLNSNVPQYFLIGVEFPEIKRQFYMTTRTKKQRVWLSERVSLALCMEVRGSQETRKSHFV